MFRLFRCKICEQLRKENEYLKKMIDSIFISKNIPPITPPEGETIIEETEEEKADIALKAKGAVKYGD